MTDSPTTTTTVGRTDRWHLAVSIADDRTDTLQVDIVDADGDMHARGTVYVPPGTGDGYTAGNLLQYSLNGGAALHARCMQTIFRCLSVERARKLLNA